MWQKIVAKKAVAKGKSLKLKGQAKCLTF